MFEYCVFTVFTAKPVKCIPPPRICQDGCLITGVFRTDSATVEQIQVFQKLVNI